LQSEAPRSAATQQREAAEDVITDILQPIEKRRVLPKEDSGNRKVSATQNLACFSTAFHSIRYRIPVIKRLDMT